MTEHIDGTSEADEMYLITIASAIEHGHVEPVPMSLVADELEVSSVSANHMIRKLESNGFVEYTPYQGVSLTDAGEAVASTILRRRRLWTVFLVEELGLSPERADEVACDLEHVTPKDVADSLSHLLGDPSSDPSGNVIPVGSAPIRERTRLRLSSMAAGLSGSVIAVDLPSPLDRFATDQGFVPGAPFEVLGVGAHDDRLVRVDGAPVHLDATIAAGILVEGRQT